MVRAQTIPLEALHLLAESDEAALARWFDVQGQILIAGGEGRDVPGHLADREIGWAFDKMYARLPVDASQRLYQTINHADAASDADLCWAGRTLMASANGLSEPSRGIVTRTLAALNEGGLQ